MSAVFSSTSREISKGKLMILRSLRLPFSKTTGYAMNLTSLYQKQLKSECALGLYLSGGKEASANLPTL